MLYWLTIFSDGGDFYNLFRYITFRAGGAFFTALVFGFLFGRPLINVLRRTQGKGQPIRDDGPESHIITKAGTPTMGGFLILLGLAVGSKLAAAKFLSAETLGILFLGLIAFAIGTASGVLLAKLMNLLSRDPINPLIGAAGVSAVPMAARVVNKVGLENNPQNFLLMHAMGPNVAGVLGSAVAAGVLLALSR